MNKKIHTQQSTGSGFTLIEMLVSVGLFTIVMTIGLSVILSVVDGNKKSQSINTVVNNLNSGIDSMVRDIKTGTDYHCVADSLGGTLPVDKSTSSGCDSTISYPELNFISTITGSERGVSYTYHAATAVTPGYISKIVCVGNVLPCVTSNITSPEINITNMRMYVKAPSAGQGQPGALIIINGTAKVNAHTISDFNIQTYVSQRLLNI